MRGAASLSEERKLLEKRELLEKRRALESASFRDTQPKFRRPPPHLPIKGGILLMRPSNKELATEIQWTEVHSVCKHCRERRLDLEIFHLH